MSIYLISVLCSSKKYMIMAAMETGQSLDKTQVA